jgi:hypothetical protein
MPIRDTQRTVTGQRAFGSGAVRFPQSQGLAFFLLGLVLFVFGAYGFSGGIYGTWRPTAITIWSLGREEYSIPIYPNSLPIESDKALTKAPIAVRSPRVDECLEPIARPFIDALIRRSSRTVICGSLPHFLSAGIGSGSETFHPTSLRTLAICPAKLNASSSGSNQISAVPIGLPAISSWNLFPFTIRQLTLNAIQLAYVSNSAACASASDAAPLALMANVVAVSALRTASSATVSAASALILASPASLFALVASPAALWADIAASPACLVSAAISAWPITTPSMSPVSPTRRSPIESFLTVSLIRSFPFPSRKPSSSSSSPATPTNTRNAALSPTLSDGEKDQNQRAKRSNIQTIVRRQLVFPVALTHHFCY